MKPAEIAVLSPLRLHNSGVASVEGGEHFQLIDIGRAAPDRSRVPCIRFATAQGFKGMESPVVVLCDVERITESEPQSLLYIAMSRARSQLIVLVHERARPFIAERVRCKLQEKWSKSP